MFSNKPSIREGSILKTRGRTRLTGEPPNSANVIVSVYRPTVSTYR